MFKFNLEIYTKEKAKELDLCYGWSVFSAGWYVGTAEQLKKIGVMDPKHP